jgi:branched-chain amino acid transport system substrate-binding protein
VIALDADMSSVAAAGGEAIRRGALIAMAEINADGGVLGRELELRVSDHRGNPRRGLDNILNHIADPNVIAVLTGVHTPVALRQLAPAHQAGIPILSPWAAGTPFIDNGMSPNFAFRLSVRDAFAGPFLVDAAWNDGRKRVALMLERTGWGESNLRAMTAALAAKDAQPVAVERFNWGDRDFRIKLQRIANSGADAILLVANPPEGARIVHDLASMPVAGAARVYSHWGLAAGSVVELSEGAVTQVDLRILQTFSLLDPPKPGRAEPVLTALCEMYQECDPAKVPAQVGLAHAYDLVHIMARAIAQGGEADRATLRDQLERIDRHEGLMRDYTPPFSPGWHEALDMSDFHFSVFDDTGVLRPL